MIAVSGQHQALFDRLPRLASVMLEAFQRLRHPRHQTRNCFPGEPRAAALMATLPSLDASHAEVGVIRRFYRD